MTFDRKLDEIMKLDYSSKELLFDLLQKRLIEERRNQIATNAKKSKKEFSKGNANLKIDFNNNCFHLPSQRIQAA